MHNIAILASHNGSTFNTVYNAIKDKTLNANIPLLISNNTNAVALQNAKDYGINNFLVNSKTHENPDEEIYKLLQENNCKYVFLSGYMKKLSPLITNSFIVINSHPSLLPKHGGAGMYGRFVHEAVIKAKEEVSGVTIHRVNDVYDDGEIIFQKSISLSSNETVDSLESKIKKLELSITVEALNICLK
ncbi:formyltransferase family protein [Sulfurimonas sp.]|jgi:phosphoribosylglycinamide formyltransferase-1|uniref:formyltransferase family protein n=1 Tax=Sulfurimonas sp. TaxID=2022749 RepID=UPI0025ED1A6B|nr:formyltransferase family protein [Sulfurimonas sp.]MBT5934539.1 phosphoribosylglycinamide formyltransferase [Sulfurimonas sp.]